MTKKLFGFGLAAIFAMAMLAGCGSDDINKDSNTGSGKIFGKVFYTGNTKVLRLGFAIALSPEDPPTQMPISMFYLPEDPVEQGMEFPYEYTAENLADGTYYIKVYGDVDTTDGALPNYEKDPQTAFIGPITITNGSAVEQDLTLQDGYQPDGDADGDSDNIDGEIPEPEEGKAAIYGTVYYSGTKTGTLYVLGFSTNPPSGPPSMFITINNPQFPQFYSKANANPGTYYLISYIDVDSDDGFGYTNIDPISGDYQKVELQEGEAVKFDFHLADQN